MQQSRITTIAFMLLMALPGLSLAKPGGLPSKQLIAGQFQRWNAALKTGNPETVAALYCEPGGVLLPTVSNKVRTSHAEILDYFEHFLELKPVGKIDKAYIRILGPDTAVNSGIYTFRLTKNGKPEDVQARYTFVYQKQNGKWCIMDHHSSAMPEVAPALSH
ncbi:MAG: SgcJ/EcaC family oxidoreductase [Gammaproteobacteria bacterium]|nr:SgcJ/EcaC family oxidoreductase [Gammaproteobacteria bacterium]MDE2346807.1 SgcJ/EcaC family oxidoreductase [Gammaproteobacteria bacterium]